MPNFNPMIFVAVFVLLVSSTISESEAVQNGRRQRYSSKQRAAIRAMPILERPSRPGHFYGNAVRRNSASGPSRTNRPETKVAAQPKSKPVKKSAKADAQLTRKAAEPVKPKLTDSVAQVNPRVK